MLDYLWPSTRTATTSDSLAAEIAALDPPRPRPKSRAIEDNAAMPPPSFSFSAPEGDEGEEDEVDEDAPPSFPAMNSIQRARQAMPPPNALPLPASTTSKPVKPRRKVVLEPGYSQLDWAKLKGSGEDLRDGFSGTMRITMEELAQHRRKDDAWAAYNGKVYNITPYLKFHPGGVGELMRSAGKDGTDLFMKTHAWVSIDGMLDSAMIGYLVRG